MNNNMTTLGAVSSMVRKLAASAVAGLLCIGLSGCVSTDMDDLTVYIDGIKAKKSSRIDPLPEITPYKSYTYGVSANRDPFASFLSEAPERIAADSSKGGLQPPVCGTGVRNCEELEQAPLDAVRMVGTLETEDRNWGIIIAANGNVHRVRVGNYMGQNFGKIMSITEDSIQLREIIPDGLGGWQERSASLALSE